MIVTLALGAALAGIAIVALKPDDACLSCSLTGLYGALHYPLYGLAVAHANDFADASDFVAVSGGLLLLYGAGTMLGPLAASAAMTCAWTGGGVRRHRGEPRPHRRLGLLPDLQARADPGERARVVQECPASPATTPADCRARPARGGQTILDRDADRRGEMKAMRGQIKARPERPFIPVRIAVLTVSDTRSLADDKSGDTLAARIAEAGHVLAARNIVRDEIDDDPR